MRTCKSCGKELPANATAARQYCDATCRYHAWLARGERPTLPTTLRWYILERDGFRCRGCGVPGGPEELVVDHIVSLSDGGLFTDETNLQTLCVPCNNGKGSLTQPEPLAPWSDTVSYTADGDFEVWVRRIDSTERVSGKLMAWVEEFGDE